MTMKKILIAEFIYCGGEMVEIKNIVISGFAKHYKKKE